MLPPLEFSYSRRTHPPKFDRSETSFRTLLISTATKARVHHAAAASAAHGCQTIAVIFDGLFCSIAGGRFLACVEQAINHPVSSAGKRVWHFATSLWTLTLFLFHSFRLPRRDCKFRTEDDATAKTFRSGLGLHSRRLLSGENPTITKLRCDMRCFCSKAEKSVRMCPH